MSKLAAILEVISSMTSTLSLDEILAEFTEKTAQIVGVDSCAISRWDRDSNTVVVLGDYISPEVERPFDNPDDVGAIYPLDFYPATAQVLQDQTSLIVYVDDPTADEAERELLKVFQRDGLLMVPSLYGGQAIGLLELYIDDKHRYQFTADDVTLCQALANQAAIAIENARLYQEAEDGRLHAEAIQVIGRALASELNYQRIARDVADYAYRLLGAKNVCVAVPEAEGFQPLAIAGLNSRIDEAGPDLADAATSLLGQDNLVRRATRGPIIIPDIQLDPEFVERPEAVKRLVDWRTMAAVPLISRGQRMGVLAAYADKPYFFSPDDVAILTSLASQAAVAIQNAQLIAELEAQREALHQVSLRLVNAQEEERRRISRELHDELGQALTALKINLDVARRALPDDKNTLPKLRRSVDDASSLAVQTLEAARNLSLELRPALLDDLGLVSALRWEIDRYEQRTNQAVHFEAELAGRKLEPELEITIYRIITEALTNVSRHAYASQISVFLRANNDRFEIGVEDDGQGFDASNWFNSPTKRKSLGLVSMRERAGLLGGDLEVISRPGHGTKVRAFLPIGDQGRQQVSLKER